MATKTVTRYRTRTVRAKPRARNNSVQVPLAIALPAGMLVAEVIQGAMNYGYQKGAQIGVKHMTGFDTESGKWSWNEFSRGGGPLLLGFLVHKLATKLGINRALSRVPVLRI
jgi:hypothetical protein